MIEAAPSAPATPLVEAVTGRLRLVVQTLVAHGVDCAGLKLETESGPSGATWTVRLGGVAIFVIVAHRIGADVADLVGTWNAEGLDACGLRELAAVAVEMEGV